MKAFDLVILTAANEAQAGGYRAQLAWRQANGLLDGALRAMVVADPGGRRVGSLGATLNVLALLADEAGCRKAPEKAFAGRRILICHSGGDSRRTPAYAAQGKVFTPVPVLSPGGAPLALFDLILLTLSRLPAPREGQLLVSSGDVLLTFDHGSVDLSRPGATGIAFWGTIERGSRHGVYVPSGCRGSPQQTECLPVADFLQKPDERLARARGALDPFGHVAVDTGLLSFDLATCGLLLDAASAMSRAGRGPGLLSELVDGACPALDLYTDLAMALAPRLDEPQYLSHVAAQGDAGHARRMRAFYRAVRGASFQVNLLPYCDFFHIGSSRELLAGFAGLSRAAQAYGFANGSGASLVGGGETSRAFVFNTLATCRVTAGPALIEGTHAAACRGIRLAGDNILTGLPPEACGVIRLPRGLGLLCLPVGRRGWAAVVYGLDDDFKTPFRDGGSCLFLNRPVEEWLRRTGVAATRLWRGDEREGMWRARLWRVAGLDEALAEAQAVAAGGGLSPSRGRRHSLAELLPRAHHGRLLALRQEIHRQVALLRVNERLLADDTLSSAAILEGIRTPEEAVAVLNRLARLLKSEALERPLLRARTLRLMAMIQEGPAPRRVRLPGVPADPQAAAFAAVAESVAVSFTPAMHPRPAAILHDQVVWVTTPVRIDFAGGWSDTPPICTEQGGVALNAAVKLNGLYPIQVMAKLNADGCIRLASIDLGARQEIRTAAALHDHRDPRDWGALAKAALILAGIAPPRPEEALSDWLKALGGGLDLTLFSALPKGSGMGTSSILGAAVIACLDRVLGIPFNTDRLIRMTSILEQRMCTGGGWQDQVGGILPGVKLIRTQPGSDQTVSLRWTTFDLAADSELKRRGLLYFTGQKRLARNILQNVVNKYLARDPEVLQIVRDLKQVALETKEALDAQDLDSFARGIARYWELKKRIDPGSTTAAIERLLARVADDTQAALLPGAGGGGFIFMLARSAAAAARIRLAFEACPPNAHARFFDFDVDAQGLKVTVL